MLLIRLEVHDANTIMSFPVNLSANDKEKEGMKNVEGGGAESTVDEACWIYEQLRSVSCTILRFWCLDDLVAN